MRPAWVDGEQDVATRRWVDLRDSYLDTPERREAYARAKEALDQELAEYAAQHPEEMSNYRPGDEVWDFIVRGQQAQAAVDKVIADHAARTAEETVFDGPMNEDLRRRMQAVQEQDGS